MIGPEGAPFHGEFTSADASAPANVAAATIALYGAGSTTAITVGANDQVLVTSIVITSAAAITVWIFDGTNTTVGAGEVILQGDFPVNGGVSYQDNVIPHYCQKGTFPLCKTSGAGAVKVTIRGTIIGR